LHETADAIPDFFCTLLTANGQGARYVIRNYDLLTEINLNGSTWSMVQDSAGVLYFGAYFGVAVYNGSYWQLFSRGQSIVRSLYADASGKIWYGGFDDFGFISRDLSAGIARQPYPLDLHQQRHILAQHPFFLYLPSLTVHLKVV
jgi:ligand-binding sensor domain-containing protein